MRRGMLVGLGIVGVLIVVALMVFSSYVSARNQMVAKDQNVKQAWSEVDVQMERRADLIPNLVQTVKGFTKEESTVFGDIANARAGMLNAQGPAATGKEFRSQNKVGCSEGAFCREGRRREGTVCVVECW